MVKKLLIGLLASGLGAAAATIGAQAASPRISIGPNILVSRDGDIPHVELMLAASPRSAKNLLGGAITFTRPDGGMACRAYSSTDGGMSWNASEFAEQVEFGGLDPQVAYTAQGTALFVALTRNRNEKGRGCTSMHVWRSEDGGRRWLTPTEIPCNPSWDHEQIAVDYTKGKYAGRIYIGALYDPPVYRVGVFRSDDDGRTWTGPIEAARGGGTIGINDVTPMVLSDGTLLLPFVDFEFRPEKLSAKDKGTSNLWLVSSSDGGVTFSPPRKVLTQEFSPFEEEIKSEALGLAGFPKLAADYESKGYKDRIYVAWEDYRLGTYRVLFSWSADHGKTWSPPRPVDDRVAAATHQFQPAVAVNKDGVVAVTWFDTRDSADATRYHQYLAASLDGGATFLPSVRVSSDPSDPRGAENRRQMMPSTWIHKERFVLSFLSAAGWTAGGHYMGLAADKDGDFHPFWVDARSGTSQIYTARVKVETPPKESDGKEPGGEVPQPAQPAGSLPSEPAALLEEVELVFDPIQYDAEKSEIAVPVRLKNVSQSAIHPPIRIEFVGFGSGEPESEVEKEFWKDKTTAILNAANGKPVEGAVFEFDRALAGSEALEPGAQTNPVVVRLKLSDPFWAPDMRWTVTGRIAGSP